MPGYLRGFVEQTFADRWAFVSRVDPFTGSQGTFKYVFLGIGYADPLDPVVHTEGLPEDLAPSTKLAMLGRSSRAMERLSNVDLHERFAEFREGLAHAPPPRHVSLSTLQEYDWDRGMSEDNWAALAASDRPRPGGTLRLFELVDGEGRRYDDWDDADAGSEEEADGNWRRRIDDEAVETLLTGESVAFAGRSVRLQPRSRRDLLPDAWFDLLDLLDLLSGRRSVRLTFYWHH